MEGPPVGPALLLLHGVSGNWRGWEPLLPELSRKWRVVLLDHRGHGESERGGSYLVVDYARDAAAFVREQFSESVSIMGHSLGAMVALSVAAECPDRVSAVALEDPPFHTMGRAIGETAYPQQFAGMQEVARTGGTVAQMADALAEIRLPSPGGTVRLGDQRDRASLEGAAESLAQLDPAIFDPLIAGRWLQGFDYESLWPRISCPALLLQGDPEAGGAFTEADATTAQRLLPLGQFIQFPGVGHQIHRTVPIDFLRRWEEFVSGVR